MPVELDEKIQSIVDWNSKYPGAEFGICNNKEKINYYLKKQSKSDEEYQKLTEEYEQIKKYYDYIRVRKCKRAFESRTRRNIKRRKYKRSIWIFKAIL